MSNVAWPVLTCYDQDHLQKIALPLGGIGTGTVSLGGRGDLRDWEIVNRPAKGFTPPATFFALWARPAGGDAVTRALEGPVDLAEYEGGFGCVARNHGLPRFRHAAFEAAYPLGQVLLSDPDVPVRVRLQAFNPLIPADADRSGIPVAILRYVLTNTTAEDVEVSICGSLQNFIGQDGSSGSPKRNRNTYRADARLAGVCLSSEGVDSHAEQWGTLALCTTASAGITHRTSWADFTWGDSLLDFWDDFSDDGRLENRTPPQGAGADAPMASLAAATTLPPGGEQSLTFLLAWHFPNRIAWLPREPGTAGGVSPDWVGNYYAIQYRDAWDAATRTAASLPALEADTLAFVGAFCASDLPEVVKEAALYNVSTLRTQTCFRTADGRFYAWEGCGDKNGCCHGSCTHVFNYEVATAFLFGELSRSLREVEFAHTTGSQGKMSFRVNLPIARAAESWPASDGFLGRWAAADGQMGCLMKLYRDWRLSGDDVLLDALWPAAKRALEFCWVPGGWDADQDGVMEGCQHNTMDVEYYGPNPQMAGWYLGALRAGEEMARHKGDTEFAATCRDLFTRGSRWVDAHLFNGDYYEHQVVPIPDVAAIYPGLRQRSGATDLTDPEFQLGAGCLVDQMVGQYMAHVCGLGYLLDAGHVQTTLQSILRYNFRSDLHGHFNHLRTFALGGEAALLMATYPKGRRPRRPFPYYNEVMTGFEHVAAVGMLYEGQTEAGLKVIQAVRDRYDGRKRSPFNEAECGHHYIRAMASWAAVLALTGFHYDGITREMHFHRAERACRWFWSNGTAWGTCEQRPTGEGTSVGEGTDVTLAVLSGTLRLERLLFSDGTSAELPEARHFNAGDTLSLSVRQ